MRPRRASRTVPHALSAHALELVARNFRALADPGRLRILHTLRDGELTVNALVEAAGQSTAAVSRHLQQLHRAGFLRRRRKGLYVWYALADPRVLRLCELMCDRVAREVARTTLALRG